jgi:hypothetical protein
MGGIFGLKNYGSTNRIDAAVNAAQGKTKKKKNKKVVKKKASTKK